MSRYHVYILANRSRTVYVGVTNDLERRVLEHREKRVYSFTAKYNITRLVFYEHFGDVNEAITAEKRIKGWTRQRKVALIEERNRYWKDLSATGYGSSSPADDRRSSREGREVLRCAQDDIYAGTALAAGKEFGR